jgi:hypothetical protein
MKRRSKTVGELPKGRRRKAPKPERRNAPANAAMAVMDRGADNSGVHICLTR